MPRTDKRRAPPTEAAVGGGGGGGSSPAPPRLSSRAKRRKSYCDTEGGEVCAKDDDGIDNDVEDDDHDVEDRGDFDGDTEELEEDGDDVPPTATSGDDLDDNGDVLDVTDEIVASREASRSRELNEVELLVSSSSDEVKDSDDDSDGDGDKEEEEGPREAPRGNGSDVSDSIPLAEAAAARGGGGSPAPLPRRSPRVKRPRSEWDRRELVDRRIEGEIKPACPVRWFRSGGWQGLFSMEEEAELRLTLGWRAYPGDDDMPKNCLEYLDPEGKGYYSGCDGEDFEHTAAAAKALREDGFIRKAYKWTSTGGFWYVSCDRRKKLTRTKATELLEKLFTGGFCCYPEGYDNFGQTPFGNRGGGLPDYYEDDESDDKDGGSERLSLVREYTFSILERSQSVAHAFWEGEAQEDGGGVLVEREDFFFFLTNAPQRFLLKFRSKYFCE